MIHLRLLFVFPFFLLTAGIADADVSLPALFGDNMVLQRSVPVNVWGTAEPGEVVSVSLDGATARVTAAANGQWLTQLPAHKAGGPYDLTVAGRNTLVFHNILVGEVWLCSGQSNMEHTIKNDLTPDAAQAAIAEADNPQIRLFTVGKATSQSPLNTLKGSWQLCSPATAGDFSATGYFFGREIQSTLGVPVGLICSAWGGTQVEAWTSLPALQKDPAFPLLNQKFQQQTDSYPAALKQYQDQTLPDWRAAVQKAKDAGAAPPRRPNAPTGPNDPHNLAVLFNGMIAPLIPYTVRGAAWYQGESNADDYLETQQYKTVFPALIRDWRSRWGEGDFPFVYVQLANFRAVQTQPSEETFWPFLREDQLKTLAIPHTAMAVAIDVNDDPGRIHPSNKALIGHRLAAATLATVYGMKISYSGPVFRNASSEGDKIRLRFDHADGLVAHAAPGSSTLTGFAIGGSDGNFVWADAAIDGNSVVVSSPQVPHPTAVRYDWAMNPIGNLYNNAGFPASPFRTDDTSDLPLPKISVDNGTLIDCLVDGRYGASSLQTALDTDFIGEKGVSPRDGMTSAGQKWGVAAAANRDRYYTDQLAMVGPTDAYAVYFSFWINSPQDLTAQSAGGPTVGMFDFVSSQSKIFLNDTVVNPATSSLSDYRTKNTYDNLPLRQGWNHILIKLASGAVDAPNRGTLAVRFTSSIPGFLKQLTSAVQIPESH